MAFPGAGRRGERFGGASLLSSVAELRGTRRAPAALPAAPAHNRPRPQRIPCCLLGGKEISIMHTRDVVRGKKKRGKNV